MMKKVLVLILGMVSFGIVFSQPLFAKEIIEILCPYSPGSSSDIVCRLVSDIAPKYVDQTFAVVNKIGASGSVAAADVIGSKPGSKIFLISQFFKAVTVNTQKVPFDVNNLAPLATFMRYKNGLTVKGDSPWKTLNEMLDYGRKNPGKLRWGHHGRSSTTHLAGLMIFRKAGIKTVDIPYGGSPDLLASLLGGHIESATLPLGTAFDHVKTGRVRYLASFGDHRFSDFPDIPCALELGFPEAASMATDLSFYIHKDAPQELKESLIEALKKSCNDPEFRKGIEKTKEELRCGGPESIVEATQKAEEIGVPIVKELGLYVGK